MSDPRGTTGDSKPPTYVCAQCGRPMDAAEVAERGSICGRCVYQDVEDGEAGPGTLPVDGEGGID